MNASKLGLVGLDANVLDKSGRARDALVDRLTALVDAGRVNVVVTGSVRQEVQHPRTPRAIREAALPLSSGVRKGLSAAQHISRIRVRAILRGNARPGKHEADAEHLSEAAELGCSHFITHDGRILRKRDDLHACFDGALRIMGLAEFLERHAPPLDRPEPIE